jgi:endoglucanase
MLQQRGTEIVDESGAQVRLRGVGLGGWMNMENFITGYPGSEQDWRAALYGVLGESKYDLFFERFLTEFFGDDDAAFLASLGLTVVRLPINYRHFESDMEPFAVREEGFRHLDRAIDACARHGIFTIIDLHAVQGYQNQDWHSDNPTHRALLWTHRHFQDRAVHLWEAIADRYRGNRWVAGYNLINEPNDPTRSVVVTLQRRMLDAIRAIDPDHLIFLDGNAYGSDLTVYTEHWPGVAYDWHDYSPPGWINGGPYPGYTGDLYVDRAFVQRAFDKRRAITDRLDAPLWIGEFGPVYLGDAESDAMRYTLARDQIEAFDAGGAHWSIWTYKDIGLQGVVYADPTGPWMELLRPALAKKARLATDSWGGQDAQIRHVMDPIAATMTAEFPGGDPMVPMGWKWTAERLMRAVLFGEALLPEFAERFRGLSDADLEALAASFALRNCVRREGLIDVLAGRPAPIG